MLDANKVRGEEQIVTRPEDGYLIASRPPLH